EKTLIYQDMFAIVSLKFFKKIYTYLEERSSDRSDIESFIEMVEQLDNPQFAQILRRTVIEILDIHK
ncbi:TPA: Rgg/GadR/MutR family transcriptional regulator, partial [Streptococcus suis]